nr:hypothetical protein GCM10020092_026650 [Actinoplanes digitatis]
MAVELLAVSTSPVPQFAAPPGYWVPVRSSQFAGLGEVLAAPEKSSVQTVVKSPGMVGGVVGSVGGVVVPPVVKTLNSYSE